MSPLVQLVIQHHSRLFFGSSQWGGKPLPRPDCPAIRCTLVGKPQIGLQLGTWAPASQPNMPKYHLRTARSNLLQTCQSSSSPAAVPPSRMQGTQWSSRKSTVKRCLVHAKGINGHGLGWSWLNRGVWIKIVKMISDHPPNFDGSMIIRQNYNQWHVLVSPLIPQFCLHVGTGGSTITWWVKCGPQGRTILCTPKWMTEPLEKWKV